MRKALLHYASMILLNFYYIEILHLDFDFLVTDLCVGNRQTIHMCAFG